MRDEVVSIIACLDFLIQESKRTDLSKAAASLEIAKQQISKDYWSEGDAKPNFTEFLSAFKCVIDFIMIENQQARDYCVKKIVEIDQDNLKDFNTANMLG